MKVQKEKSVESFWVKLPKSVTSQIKRRQQKWEDAVVDGTGEPYFALSFQPFAFGNTMKVNIITSRLAAKLQKHIESEQ